MQLPPKLRKLVFPVDKLSVAPEIELGPWQIALKGGQLEPNMSNDQPDNLSPQHFSHGTSYALAGPTESH